MSTNQRIKVVVYGVGQIGSGVIRMITERDWLELAGAIDVDPEKVGKDAGDVTGAGRKLGVVISNDPKTLLAESKPDIVIHAVPITSFEKVDAEILKILETGTNVISTSDARLSYPWVSLPDLAKRIDEVAKRKGVTFLETGLNPGFIKDLVPIAFTGVCEKVRRVTTQRVSDMTGYSPAVVRDYMGIGILPNEFEDKLANNLINLASISSRLPMIDMIASALGWKIDKVSREARPMVSTKRKKTLHGQEIEIGMVGGIETVQKGIIGKEEVIIIEWKFVVEPEKDGIEVLDRIIIGGEPNIDIVVRGLSSIVSTYAHVINSIPQVIAAPPGLITVRELPVAAAHV